VLRFFYFKAVGFDLRSLINILILSETPFQFEMKAGSEEFRPFFLKQETGLFAWGERQEAGKYASVIRLRNSFRL
jgi:hypothetical protein